MTQSDPSAPVERVPWWAMILAFLAASFAAGLGVAILASVQGDGTLTAGDAAPTFGQVFLAFTFVMGVTALPFFVILRLMMIWLKRHDLPMFVVIWFGTALLLGSYLLGDISITDGRFWRYFAELALGPVALAGGVQYLVERAFRSTD